jgi:hypothetical protein
MRPGVKMENALLWMTFKEQVGPLLLLGPMSLCSVQKTARDVSIQKVESSLVETPAQKICAIPVCLGPFFPKWGLYTRVGNYVSWRLSGGNLLFDSCSENGKTTAVYGVICVRECSGSYSIRILRLLWTQEVYSFEIGT